jgi:F420H(2)-dependent quinone reductase
MSEVRPYSPQQERIGNAVITVMSRLQTGTYRLSGGRIGGRFLRGAPVGLLTHTGRRSGEARTSPLLVLERGEDVVVAASKGGFTGNPAWYYNLLAHPDCEIQIGRRVRRMRARLAEPEERDELWPAMDAMYRDFAEYRARAAAAGREIALFVLAPR